MTPPSTSRLAQFHRQVASENVNLAIVEALRTVRSMPSRTPYKLVKLAVVGSEPMALDLETRADVVRLQRANWRLQLADADISIVLVETDYACLDSWRVDLVAASPDNELVALPAYCRAAGIPCALWVTLDAAQTSLVDHLLPYFPVLFVAAPDTHEELRRSFGARVARMPPFVDTGRFNPAMVPPDAAVLPRGAMPIVSDCLSTVMFEDPDGALLGLLQQAMPYKTWLYESREFVRPRESYMPAHMLRRSLGTIDSDAAAAMLKLADVAIVLENKNRPSWWHHHRKLYEAMACRCLPVSNLIDAEGLGPGDTAAIPGHVLARHLCARDPDAMRDVLAGLTSKRLLRERLQHVAFRETLERHAVEVRLREMLAVFGIAAEPAATPKVSVLLVTNRIANFAHALRSYRAQSYACKELVVVVNTEADLDALREQLLESDSARIVGVPAHWPIGVCMNAAIELANGAYWAKIDDDDLYGPAYLADYILQTRIVDFDIAGKSNVFTFDERNDRTVLRRSNEHPHSPGSALAGGTLFVRNDPSLRFDDAARGLVDITFQWQALADGRCLYASDPFNYVQVRRADRRQHTWRIEVAEMGDAEDVGPGLALAGAFA